jgi:WD40 repeat protein
MKKKAKVLIISLFLSAFIMIFSFGRQEPEWKGKIEYENGVKIIQNPEDSLYGEIKFNLEEDLSIGNEDDENYLFYRARDIQIDTEGNIYILDSGNHRLQIFDKDGKYFRSIGKRGQGPGEFSQPSCLQLDDETGNIFVTDYRSMTIIIFEKEGKHIDKDVHFGEFLNDFYLDSDSCIWGIFSLPGINVMYRSIKKLSLEGKVEKTFAEIPYHIQRIEISRTSSSLGAYMINSGYEDDLFISKVDSHTFIYGHSKKYELVAVDKSGKTLFKIRKDEPPIKITKSERDRIINRIKGNIMKQGHYVPDVSLKFPDYMAYFYSITTDDRSQIYVRKNPVSRESNTIHEYDVFNKEGRYIYKINLNHYPDVIRNGYLYTIVVNEETGLEQIKRYRIKNWGKIKEGIS